MNEEQSFKQMISMMINICTRVITLIFLIATIGFSLLDSSFPGFRTKDVVYIILIGVITGLLCVIYFIPKKISKKTTILLDLIYFLATNVTVLTIGAKLKWYVPKEKSSFLFMEGMIIFIYVIVYVSCYLFDRKRAAKMNYMLKQRKLRKQKENEADGQE